MGINDVSSELTKDQEAFLSYFSDITEFNKYDLAMDSLAGFSFDKFFKNYMYHEKDYGGFIIITDKQYLVGYNKNQQGVEHHCDAIAKAYVTLHKLPDLPCSNNYTTIVNILCSISWLGYGVCISMVSQIIPNAIGLILSLVNAYTF